jgi:hypothetical protein
VGTSSSVISRLEDAEYRGHSLAMLRRIADAVGMKVVVRFVPLDTDPRPGWILDKAQKEAVKKHIAGGGAGGAGRRTGRPKRVRRTARRSM